MCIRDRIVYFGEPKPDIVADLYFVGSWTDKGSCDGTVSYTHLHAAWNVPNLERHSSSRMPDAAWLEIPDFTIRIVAAGCIWNDAFR